MTDIETLENDVINLQEKIEKLEEALKKHTHDEEGNVNNVFFKG